MTDTETPAMYGINLIKIMTSGDAVYTTEKVLQTNVRMAGYLIRMRRRGESTIDLSCYDSESVTRWVQWAETGAIIDTTDNLTEALQTYIFAKEMAAQTLCRHIMVDVIRPQLDSDSPERVFLLPHHVRTITRSFQPGAEVYVRMLLRLCAQLTPMYVSRSFVQGFMKRLPSHIVGELLLFHQGYGEEAYNSETRDNVSLNGFGVRTAQPRRAS